MEYFSVYNRFGEKTDQVIERNDAHRRGICHRVIHFLIINAENQILIQQRSPAKETGANLWDVSVGGHVESTEDIGTGIIRETKEELGLDISLLRNSIDYLFSFKDTIIKDNGAFIDNEFYDVFILKSDFRLDQVVLQESEVQSVQYIDYADFKSAVIHKDKTFMPHDTEYKMLFPVLDDYLKQ